MAPYWETEKAFADAVETATERATQRVAKTHRRRLMLSGGLVGLIAALVVAIPTTIGITNNSKHENCALITTLATTEQEESEEANVSTAKFEQESKDRFGLSQKKFDELIQEGRERRTRHIDTIKSVADHTC